MFSVTVWYWSEGVSCSPGVLPRLQASFPTPCMRPSLQRLRLCKPPSSAASKRSRTGWMRNASVPRRRTTRRVRSRTARHGTAEARPEALITQVETEKTEEQGGRVPCAAVPLSAARMKMALHGTGGALVLVATLSQGRRSTGPAGYVCRLDRGRQGAELGRLKTQQQTET